MKRVVTVVAAVAVVALALATINPVGAQEGTGEDEKLVFTMGTTNSLDSLNPFKAVEVPSYELINMQYSLLVEFSQEDLSPSPGLADTWEASDDGLTWTYNLNPDAMWSDGEPVTSDDVKYTYERIIEEEQGTYIDYVRQIEHRDPRRTHRRPPHKRALRPHAGHLGSNPSQAHMGGRSRRGEQDVPKRAGGWIGAVSGR